MAKKKSKQSVKDDLIESLMNDVKEISDHSTLNKVPKQGDVFLDSVSGHDKDDDDDKAIGLEASEYRVDETNTLAKEMWQGLYEDPTPAADLKKASMEQTQVKPRPKGKSQPEPKPEWKAEQPLRAEQPKAELKAEQPLRAEQPKAELKAEKPKAERFKEKLNPENDVLQSLVSDVLEAPTADVVPEMLGAEENSALTGDDDEVTFPVGFEVSAEPARASSHDEKTININELSEEEQVAAFNPPQVEEEEDHEKTVAVEGFANRQPRREPEPSRVNLTSLRPTRPQTAGSVYTSSDASLLQAESLKLAQQRILELEKEVEKYRQENEELASAGEIIRNRCEELTARVIAMEKEKQDIAESLNNELIIVKGTSQYKDAELVRARQKIEELEIRLKSDFKKIRVRERELENRLELVKAEKAALLRAKDENILDLKRKIDHLQGELDNYRSKVVELNKNIDLNQEQFKRTVRALRLALSNLETKEENIVPLKKAD